MAAHQEKDREQWCREKVDIICSALQWLNRKNVEEYVENCKDENEVEVLFSMLSEGLNNNEKQPHQANDAQSIASPPSEQGATAREIETEAQEFVNVITGEEIDVAVLKLIDMFPEVDSEYIQMRCKETQGDSDLLAALMSELLDGSVNGVDALQQLFRGMTLDEYQANFADFEDSRTYECGICCSDNLSRNSMGTCQRSQGHLFCLECIKRYVGEEIGQGRVRFRCLTADCGAEILEETLWMVTPKAVYASLLEKRQLEEVLTAKIEGLEACPFCDFMAVLDNGNTVFTCMKCKKDSCRLCKKPNHLPEECADIREKKQNEARTHLENEMAEAMIRECSSCKKRFIKSDGCNKMTCSCGTIMCYICRKPVENYDHFNYDPDVDEDPKKCPLWTDSDAIHQTEVRKAAEAVKRTMNLGEKLLNDPTVGIL
ncbi:E3 ubiquitin-protein ligase RNF216-like isoform X2 [Penaeus indicus]|uniref:E3 ubiquitin-protein ligase RNF216-like isoform X2 n=1 Tax=Penaeus indicus TaxID=29960 RepID=UPI00300D4930